eukprot:346972_1
MKLNSVTFTHTFKFKMSVTFTECLGNFQRFQFTQAKNHFTHSLIQQNTPSIFISRIHSYHSIHINTRIYQKFQLLNQQSYLFTTNNNTNMSGMITDFFKPKETNNKKRKHDEVTNEDTKKIIENEPSKKRMKLNTNNNVINTEKKEESEDEDLAQDPVEEVVKEKEITYANCDELLDKSWKKMLNAEFTKPYFKQLRKNLEAEQNKKVEIFPPVNLVFAAFEYVPWDKLKVVVIGQDPYHDDGQAEGLCFSVPKGIKIPSSLRNMYKEATSDFGFKAPKHGNLIQWAEQGVLLLNTVLTVQAHKANSHKKYGWQQFTDAVIQIISDKHDGVVFILWGAQAQKKKKIINISKHKIVESAHPSGLSAHRGFYGSKPYSKTNAFLKELGKEPINWQIDDK